jgi:hypothetical protein
MKPGPLLAAFAKVERAKAQVSDVEARIQLWAQSKPYSVVSKINPDDPREEIWSFIPKPIGFDLPVIIGETLHNVRSPLDQMLSAVAELQRGISHGVAFPFGKTADIFEHALAKQKKLLPAEAIDMIRVLKPYKGGNDLLWAINELNRGDKHRPRLIPVLTNSSWQLGFMGVEKGKVYIMGDRRGGHLSVDQMDGKPYVAAKSRHPYAEGEVEILTCAPGTKFHTDMKPLCQIAFGKIEVLKTEPVVKVLHQMRDLVESILQAFERRFFR